MILVIDTSSSQSALSLIEPPGGRALDALFGSREAGTLGARFRDLVKEPRALTKVAIATGPGSFTGLRRGAAFGVGLAMGLRIPVVPLPTLELQAARGRGRFTAVAEAGRGRFYFLVPGGRPELGGPDEIPRDRPLVGLLSSSSEGLMWNTDHTMAGQRQLQTVAEAARELLKTAREVSYGSVKLEYMQSLGSSKS